MQTSAQAYHQILVNAFAYLGVTDLHTAECMTLSEYSLRMEAYQLSMLDHREDMAYQSWLNQAVQATTGRKNPKWKFSSFKKFEKALGLTKQRQHLAKLYGYEASKTQEQTTAEIFAKRQREFWSLRKNGLIDITAWKKQYGGDS